MLLLLIMVLGLSYGKPTIVAAASGNYSSVTAENITTNNATLRARLSPDIWVTSCGLYFGTSQGNMQIVKNETVYRENKYTNNIWYTCGSDFFYLSSGTTYYYRFFYVSNGQTYFSSVESFRTNMPAQFVRDSKGLWYNYGNGTYPKNCWKNINGSWYYFGKYGYAYTGWKKIGSKWYYFDTYYCQMKTGWLYYSKNYYYLNSNGVMCTGWKQINGSWYHFTGGGVRQYNWCKISGSWYYLGSNGIMRTGWVSVNGCYYYLRSGGSMCTGWKKVGSSWYYLGGNGARRYNWCYVSGKWYYLGSNGVMRTGWVHINSTYYYLNGSGVMCCNGWYRIGGYWYYLRPNGARVNNSCVGGYYIGSNGIMLEGNAPARDINNLNEMIGLLGKNLSYVNSRLGSYNSIMDRIYQYPDSYLWNEPSTAKVGFKSNGLSYAVQDMLWDSSSTNRNAYFERMYRAVYAKKGKPSTAKVRSNGDIFVHWRTSGPSCIYINKTSSYVEMLVQTTHDHCE